MRRCLCFVLLFALITLTACQGTQSIAEDRTQAQAVEIVSLLNEQGIAAYAEKSRGGGRFSVTVPAREYHKSITLVRDHSLADEAKPQISDLLSSNSILPGSRETEKLRLDFALALQLEEALENINGVLAAKVIVRKYATKDTEAAGGSITIQTDPGVALAKDTIASLVQRVFPEIGVEKFAIDITEQTVQSLSYSERGVKRSEEGTLFVPLRKFLLWQVPEGDHNGLVLAFFAAVGLTAVLFFFLGYSTSYIRSVGSSIPEGETGDAAMIGIAVERRSKKLPEAS